MIGESIIVISRVGWLHKLQEKRILSIIMFVPNKNPQGYKYHVIYFIVFAFAEGVTIVDWVSNMNIYVSNIVELYRGIIIGHLGNSGT